MTTETVIQRVRSKLGQLDGNGEQIVAAALEVLKEAGSARPAFMPEAESFLSSNISMAEYETLPQNEKLHYQDEAEKLNQEWVRQQLEKYQAKWLMVVDGQAVSHGKDLDDYPEDLDFFALCERLGKYPFIFFSPSVFVIEESITQWHDTDDPADAYPALAIKISENNTALATEADLDTGAVECYCSAELLLKHNVILPDTKRFLKTSRHLSQPYAYFSLRLWVELLDQNGESRRRRTTMICVADWKNSPFVAINPRRTFLLGRKLLLHLRPRVTLDFDARPSEVQFKEQVS